MRPAIMKQLLFCLLSVICLLGMMLSVSAETPQTAIREEQPEQIHYACIVRNKADYNSADIGSMEDGAAVTVWGEKGKFYKIDCYDMTGFVAMSQIREADGQYYIQCDPASSETEIVEYTAHTQALELRHSLLALAREQVGKPYIYGSTGPKGFDCSGLTSFLYKNHDITLRRTASQQLSDGIIVSSEGLQVGDLLFFKTSWETSLTSHVGIYAGDNKMIHAGSYGIACVELTGDYYEGNFLCARRVINTDCTPQEPESPAVNARGILPASGISGRRAG